MSYGPKLTAKQIRALQAEIAAFDEKATLDEIERASVSGKDIDAYQKWVDEKNGGLEPVEANPDQLTDDCATPWSRAPLLSVDTTGLSALEKDAWAMCMRAGFPEEEAAASLGITRKAVEMALRRAKRKLRGQL